MCTCDWCSERHVLQRDLLNALLHFGKLLKGARYLVERRKTAQCFELCQGDRHLWLVVWILVQLRPPHTSLGPTHAAVELRDVLRGVVRLRPYLDVTGWTGPFLRREPVPRCHAPFQV